MTLTRACLSVLLLAACSAEDLPVDEPRQVTTAMLAGAVVGIPYQQPLAADCPADAPPVWGITSGGLPPGLQVQASSIVGTPSTIGSFGFTLIVTCRGTGTRAFELVVVAAAELTITIPDASGALPPGRIGVPYQVQLSATSNRTGSLEWSIAPGSALPPGLVLSTTGLISGTPEGLPGTSHFLLEVRQGQLGATREASLVLGNPLLHIVGPPDGILPEGIESVFDSVLLRATGGTGPLEWSLPEPPPSYWARIDQGGMLRFIPNLGTTQLRVRVMGGMDTAEIVLSVRARRNTSALMFGLRNSDFIIDPRATSGSIVVPLGLAAEGGTPPYTWDSFGFPGGLAFRNTEYPHFLGTAPVGRHQAVFTIIDANGGKMSSPATVGVVNDLVPGAMSQPYVLSRGQQVLIPVPLVGGWAPHYCPLYYGTLPPGLTLARVNDAPVIIGSVQEAGTWTATTQCNDSAQIYDWFAGGSWHQETWVTFNFEVH